MNIVLTCTVVTLGVALTAAAVFLILVLVQVRRAVGELTTLIRKVNVEVGKVERVTEAMSGVASVVGGSTGKLVLGALQAGFGLFQKFRRKKTEEPFDDDEDGGTFRS